MSQYPQFGQPPPYGQQPSYQSAYSAPQGGPDFNQDPRKPVNPLALTSTIAGGIAVVLCGLMFFGFFCCCGGGIFVAVIVGSASTIASITAITTGHMALVHLNREPDKESGKELAIIGLATGYPALVFTVLFVIAIVFFLAAALTPAVLNNNRPPPGF